LLISVRAVGVCGSDLHQYAGTHSRPVNYPVVLGYEFSGLVAKIEIASKALRKAIAWLVKLLQFFQTIPFLFAGDFTILNRSGSVSAQASMGQWLLSKTARRTRASLGLLRR
jgi:Alcohol dehydrogenase GroES-like domain